MQYAMAAHCLALVCEHVVSFWSSAQAAGLLCEEAGNYLDNVKYCGYCPYHYQKLVSAVCMGPTGMF